MNKIIFLVSLIQLFGVNAVENKTKLVDIKKINPQITVELVYATPFNFTHARIYDTTICCVLSEVATQLDAIQKELEKMISKQHPKGLGLKIWDGYRPLSAQKKMWDACAKQYPDETERENYISNPAKGGRHTRGTTVDVTIIDRATGKELAMGTGFDDFSKKAWKDYAQLSNEVKKNRKILDTVMEKHGFNGIKSEWWHFDYKDWQHYEPLDVALAQLD